MYCTGLESDGAPVPGLLSKHGAQAVRHLTCLRPPFSMCALRLLRLDSPEERCYAYFRRLRVPLSPFCSHPPTPEFSVWYSHLASGSDSSLASQALRPQSWRLDRRFPIIGAQAPLRNRQIHKTHCQSVKRILIRCGSHGYSADFHITYLD